MLYHFKDKINKTYYFITSHGNTSHFVLVWDSLISDGDNIARLFNDKQILLKIQANYIQNAIPLYVNEIDKIKFVIHSFICANLVIAIDTLKLTANQIDNNIIDEGNIKAILRHNNSRLDKIIILLNKYRIFAI